MEDWELIEGLKKRSSDVLKELEETYGGYLYAIAERVVGNREDAQECVNDSLFKVWQTIPPQEPKSLKGYIGAMIRNVSLDCYRKQHASKRDPAMMMRLEEWEELGECPSERDTSQIGVCISAYLERVSKEKQYLFVRRYYYGDTLLELSKHRGISLSKVKTTLFRMRKELKKELMREDVWQ